MSQDDMLNLNTQFLSDLLLDVNNQFVCFDGFSQTLRQLIRILMLNRKGVVRRLSLLSVGIVGDKPPHSFWIL